jgi:hypothetical protein
MEEPTLGSPDLLLLALFFVEATMREAGKVVAAV